MVASHTFRPVERFLIGFDGDPSSRRAVERVCASPLLKGPEAHIRAASGDTGKLAAAAGQLRAAGFSVQEHAIAGTTEEDITASVQDHGIGMLVLGKIRPFPPAVHLLHHPRGDAQSSPARGCVSPCGRRRGGAAPPDAATG